MNETELALINKATKELTQDDIQVLKRLFVHLYKRSVPSRVSTTFLHGNVAWGLQAKDQGHDPIQLREKIYQQFTKQNKHKHSKSKPANGTQLIREWRGHTYHVTKVKEGYAYHNKTFKSLTPIAKHITGYTVSGPRFFGFAKPSNGK